jgi:hypothetical protein
MNWLQENRWRLLLTVVLVVLWSLICGLTYPEFTEPANATGTTLETLEKSYAEYNAQYFGNKLPKDTVIDYNLHDSEFMAVTRKPFGGSFHISFNPTYVAAERVSDLTMLHEMCHVKNWGDGHELKWRACMIQLDLQGVFREELIDSYTEKMK